MCAVLCIDATVCHTDNVNQKKNKKTLTSKWPEEHFIHSMVATDTDLKNSGKK